jgi:hypothetical protein
MNSHNSNSSPKSSLAQLVNGVIFSNLFAFAAFFLAHWISNWDDDTGNVLIVAEFILVPVGMGIIAMKFWINAVKGLKGLILVSIINTIIAIALSAFFMGEGVICLVIVTPLILGFMWAGIVIGKYIYRTDNTTLKASTLLIFIGLFFLDAFSEHHYTNMVSDEITINAPKEKVWKYIAAYPLNTEKPDYWLFNIGLPNPVQSTVTGDSVGACRKCIFSNNAIFDEVIVEYKKDSLFTFDITSQPADPEIIGHIEIQKGQFVLRQNPDGSTTLIGNSWYKLNVYPAWYYDWWAEDITRNVHIRVMKHIKKLAEHDV